MGTRPFVCVCVCVFRTQQRTDAGPDHRQERDQQRDGSSWRGLFCSCAAHVSKKHAFNPFQARAERSVDGSLPSPREL